MKCFKILEVLKVVSNNVHFISGRAFHSVHRIILNFREIKKIKRLVMSSLGDKLVLKKTDNNGRKILKSEN